MMSSSSSETTVLRCFGSSDEASGGGEGIVEAFGTFEGSSTCALRLRFAALDLAMMDWSGDN